MNNFLPLSVIFSLAIVSAEAASMERGDAKWTFNPYSYAQQIIHTQTRNGVLKQCFILAKKVLPKDKRTAEAEKLIESIYNEHRQAAIEASRQEKIAQQQKKDD
ncbi:hypothetical protein OAN22_02565, partial [Alphaproteobacteria bacterium]|nr:hypothetical protein [Alphaproteobacteria bacterium]